MRSAENSGPDAATSTRAPVEVAREEEPERPWRPWKRLRRGLARALGPALTYYYIRLLRMTMRLEYRNAEVLERAREQYGHYILAFWHSRFLMMPYSYPGPRLVVLLSRHRDAQLLSDVLRRFDLDVAFGSSSAGGVTGLRSVLRTVRAGSDVGLAPDGPRGPRRQVKPGVIAIARLGGLPIVPMAFSAARAGRLNSWDRTVVPRPFTRGLFVCGELHCVPRHATAEEQERHRAALERELDRLTDWADHEVGLKTESPDARGGNA